MKADIHPKYETIKVTCSCGNQFETGSTYCAPLSVEVCSECHPFYTGKQKVIDTGGRIDRFKRRYSSFGGNKEANESEDKQSDA